MKKLAVVVIAIGIIAALGIGAYAHGGWGNAGRGNYGGHMMGNRNSSPMMGGGYGPGSMMQGRGAWGGQGYCGGYGAGQRGGWNAPGQSGMPQQALSEEQLKDAAQTYVDQYLPGYAIETIEQDQWRPMHYVTLKGENGAELHLSVHNFSGQVMHVFGVPAQEAPTE